jgi:hypothetical protein
MLRIIGVLALLGGCWLPPHLPDPIPRNQEHALNLEETRNPCTEPAEQAPDLRTGNATAAADAPGARPAHAPQR